MRRPALAVGVDITGFWDLSPREIAEYVAAVNERRRAEQDIRTKEACYTSYRTAYLIAIGFNSPRRFPNEISEAFPGVFDDRKVSGGIPISDWQRSKEHMQEYARSRRENK